MIDRELYYNESGCPDPTAYDALKPIVEEDKNIERKVHHLINTLKFIVDWAGFEFIGRIQIKDKKTGKEYRKRIQVKNKQERIIQ